MDTNTTIEALSNSANALTKLQEIIQKIFNPKWTRKQNEADMEANERKLQMIRDNPDMDIVFIGDEMHARKATYEELTSRAEKRMLTDAVRQEQNIESVLEIAVEELRQVESVSERPVDDDWITRIFNIVKDVSNEEMQYIWGKILAGEVKRPGSFSMRTLETIRNISQIEAETFQKLMPLLVFGGGDWFITSKAELHNKYGITYEDIMLLDECGLMISNGTVSMTLTISSDKILLHNREYCLVTEGLGSRTVNFSFGVYSLTSTGKELFNILEHEPNDDYFIEFVGHVFKENRHTNLKVKKVEKMQVDKIRVTEEVVCEFRV